MPRKRRVESPYEQIVRRCQQAQAETIQVAEELVQMLREQSAYPIWSVDTWLELVKRWESAETVNAALHVCLEIVDDQDPLTRQNLRRQLRHWRRSQGKPSGGWLERRTVNGAGPSVYYRYREPGDRALHTEYYGRADRALVDLVSLPLVASESPRGAGGETGGAP